MIIGATIFLVILSMVFGFIVGQEYGMNQAFKEMKQARDRVAREFE